mgnify:CR=1 FL=1
MECEECGLQHTSDEPICDMCDHPSNWLEPTFVLTDGEPVEQMVCPACRSQLEIVGIID